MNSIDNQNVKQKFTTYPDEVAAALLGLRSIILQVAAKHDLPIEEALKWDQPSYLTKTGSTIRIDWSAKQADQYKIFFNCKTRLVETFKEVYGDIFKYEGNRVIVFRLSDQLPMDELRQCILMTLKYHQLKQLPLLGA